MSLWSRFRNTVRGGRTARGRAWGQFGFGKERRLSESMSKVRVYEVARQLNMSNRELVALLQEIQYLDRRVRDRGHEGV